MQIRLPAIDPTSAVRISGPPTAPDDFYWAGVAHVAAGGGHTIQIDEPALARTLSRGEAEAMRGAFARLRAAVPFSRLMLTANPTAISRASMPLAVRLPVDALYLNVLARPRLLVEALALAPAGLDLVVPEIVDQRAGSCSRPAL